MFVYFDSKLLFIQVWLKTTADFFFSHDLLFSKCQDQIDREVALSFAPNLFLSSPGEFLKIFICLFLCSVLCFGAMFISHPKVG